MRRLVFFTYSFPSGIGERWKFDDIVAFSRFYDEVLVIPFVRKPLMNKFDFPSNVAICESVFVQGERRPRAPLQAIYCLSLGVSWVPVMLALVAAGKWTRARMLLGALFSAAKSLAAIRRLGRPADSQSLTDIYFFWGVGGAEVLPFLPKSFNRKIVCFHNFDLYPSRARDGYFPLRAEVLDAADVIAPCSQDGVDYLAGAFPTVSDKLVLKRLGVEDIGLGRPSADGVLRVTSCALVEPIKRIDLICEAISKCQSRVEWTHIGNGSELDRVRDLAGRQIRGGNLSFRFTGFLPPDEVRAYYVENPVDLFLSLSSGEGVPVSIMEAMSAGIPVMATDVGGVRELVDSSVGELLDESVDAEVVAERIDAFAQMDAALRDNIRAAARDRAEAMCRAPSLSLTFAAKVMG